MLVDCALGDKKVARQDQARFRRRRGEECWLTFDTARWHLFAADTGLAYF